MSARTKLARHVNNVLRPMKVQIVPGFSTDPAMKSFIPARKTIAAARKAGLSLGEYIDQNFAEPGATQDAVNAILKLAEMTGACDVVCEIGPGSARYAVEVIRALHPGSYEIYETAPDWLPVLRQLPNALIRDCDGRTLSQTPDSSVDLAHAHKVFVYTECYVTVGYMAEMARVVRRGGTVAFDIVTDPCLDEETIAKWLRDTSFYRPVPREWAVDFMRRRGLSLLGSHFTPLPPGRSELLVFRRD